MSTRYNIYVMLLAALMLIQTSCHEYEKEPLNIITEELVYDEMDINAYYAEQVLNNIYTYLPDGFNRIDGVFLDAATDDAIASEDANNIEIIAEARQNPTHGVDQVWGRSYQAIRRVNIFLSKIDRVPTTEETKVFWKAEARFIRAISYFELLKRYGGVPLLGDRVLELTDELDIPRNSFEEGVQYVVGELNDISDKLRIVNQADDDPNFGRITQGAALALKSRLLLYAASPLHNPANDQGKWQQALEAAKDVIDLNAYSLHPNFVTLFITRKNNEIILSRQRARSQNIERTNAPIGFTAPNLSEGAMSPTQELVDAFPMKNGLAIGDAGSGYLADRPYHNRDPRFEATVFYNGASWLQRDVETFEGGLDKPNRAGLTQTRTGYYMRKFMGNFGNTAAYSNQDHNFIIFRYAEILLNYAEAANELGQTTEALEQLKLIRERARISSGEGDVYGLKANMDQVQMREAIQLERRLELAFEEHRFWDVRRWKEAETVFNKKLHGMKITKTDEDLNYNVEEVAQIRFIAPKMYLYPIPFDEVLKNLALEQNPGWNN